MTIGSDATDIQSTQLFLALVHGCGRGRENILSAYEQSGSGGCKERFPMKLEVLLAPVEFTALKDRDLSDTVCVVFDVLRATSSMVRALAEGAREIVPVGEIEEALAARAHYPDALLAGERHGLRITAAQSGGIEFDLGNSPREFTREKVRDKTVIMTTTNGTRALRACRGARAVAIGAFLNLSSVARWAGERAGHPVLIVCSGTQEEASYEDTLAAGALCAYLKGRFRAADISDSGHVARQVYESIQSDPEGAVSVFARNARRLRGMAELREDVRFCLQRDQFDLVGAMEEDGVIRRQNISSK